MRRRPDQTIADYPGEDTRKCTSEGRRALKRRPQPQPNRARTIVSQVIARRQGARRYCLDVFYVAGLGQVIAEHTDLEVTDLISDGTIQAFRRRNLGEARRGLVEGVIEAGLVGVVDIEIQRVHSQRNAVIARYAADEARRVRRGGARGR